MPGGLRDPTLLALGWGVVATWWVGPPAGVALAIAARWGGWPRRSPGDLLGPIAVVLGVTAAVATLAGLTRYTASQLGWVWLIEPMASRVPQDRHEVFLANLWAHTASYGVGGICAVGLLGFVLVQRRRLAK